MPNYTTNFHLVKPLPEEFYNIAVENGNMDILDTALKDLKDAIAQAGGVRTVANKLPDAAGNVALVAGDVGAAPSDIITTGTLSIPATGWTLDVASGLYYRDVPIPGAVVTDAIQITIALASGDTAASCGLRGVGESRAGAARLYADSVPEAAMTATWERRRAQGAAQMLVCVVMPQTSGGGMTIPVYFTAEQVGGVSGNTDSTGIKITFDQTVISFGITDIVVINGTGQVTVGSLTGEGSEYLLSLTSATVQGDITVAINDFFFYQVKMPPQTVPVYAKPRVSFTAVQTGGANGSADSTGIVFTFDKSITGLTAADITITNGTGTVTKGTLSGSGATWTLGITTTVQGNITASIANFGSFVVMTGTLTVAVYAKTRVTVTATQQSGSTSNNTTAIRLVFSAAVSGLTAANITLANGTASAIKGTLSGSGTTWDLTIDPNVAGVVTSGTITVTVASFGNFTVTTGTLTVTIYQPLLYLYNSGVDNNAITGGWVQTDSGSSGALVINATDMQVWLIGAAGAYTRGGATNKTVDLSLYTSAIFSVRTSGITGVATMEAFVAATSAKAGGTYYSRTSITTNYATATNISLSLSGVNSAYLKFGLSAHDSVPRGDIWVEKITLKK